MISMQTFICCTLRNPSTKIYSQRFSKAFFFLRDYFLLVAVTAFLFTKTLVRHFLLKVDSCCAFVVVNDTQAMSTFLFEKFILRAVVTWCNEVNLADAD